MKLTLNIEPGLTERMKAVAKARNTSISKMVESFFKKEIESDRAPFRMMTREELPEWVRSLAIKNGPVGDIDYKAEYHKHLEEKYRL